MVGIIKGRVDYRTLAIVCAALFATSAVLLPLAVSSYPALVDFPAHLARHYVGGVIDASPDLQKFYSYSWRPVPNMAGDLLFILLNMVYSPLDSERMIIAIAIGLWVFVPVVLHRAIWGYWSAAPFLGSLVVFNNALRGGLENFLISSALGVFAFAVWISWKDHIGFWRLVGFSIVATAVYFGHALAWMILGLLLVPYELQKAYSSGEAYFARVVRLARAAAPFLPGAILSIFLRMTAGTSGDILTLYGGIESRIDVLLSVVLMYDQLPDLLALTVLIGIIFWRIGTATSEVVHRSMIAPIITLFIVCLITPAVIQDVRGMHVRAPAILVIVLIASMQWANITPRQWRVIAAAFIVAMVARSVSVTTYWLRHQSEVTELRKGFEKLDRGAVLLPTVNEKADTGEFHWASSAYAVIDRHAFTPALYPDVHTLSMKPAYARLTRLVVDPIGLSKLPLPGSELPEQPDRDAYWLTWWKDFSHVLVLSREPVEPHFKDHVELVSEGSFFRLYRVRR